MENKIEEAINTLVFLTKELREEKRKIDECKMLDEEKQKQENFTIKTQEDFSKKYFPDSKLDENGFALSEKDFWSLFDRKLPYGPLPYRDGAMNLCHSALQTWEGRNQELAQWNFQNDLVRAGKMRGKIGSCLGF